LHFDECTKKLLKKKKKKKELTGNCSSKVTLKKNVNFLELSLKKKKKERKKRLHHLFLNHTDCGKSSAFKSKIWLLETALLSKKHK